MQSIELPYGQLIASRPLLHGLVQSRLKVSAQIAALQALASIDAACRQLDRDRDTIIHANLDPEAPASAPGSFNVTALGSHLLQVLESTPVKISVITINPADLGDLTASGRDLLTLRWFAPFPLATDAHVADPVTKGPETLVDAALEGVEALPESPAG